MGEDSGGGGCGCIGSAIVIAAGIFLVMVYLGHDPQEAAGTGIKWGVGIVGGVIALIVALWLGLTALSDIRHALWRRRTNKWENIE
jgi:hypothetical protein